MKRTLAIVATVRKRRDVDEDAERRTYWATRTAAERLAEVSSLRALRLLERFQAGTVERVFHRRRRGEPAIAKSEDTCALTPDK